MNSRQETLKRTVWAVDSDKMYKTKILISITIFNTILAKPVEKRVEKRGIIIEKERKKLSSLVKDVIMVFKCPKN